jgi:hypothetical protein
MIAFAEGEFAGRGVSDQEDGAEPGEPDADYE